MSTRAARVQIDEDGGGESLVAGDRRAGGDAGGVRGRAASGEEERSGDCLLTGGGGVELAWWRRLSRALDPASASDVCDGAQNVRQHSTLWLGRKPVPTGQPASRNV
jgi:hypothetical protein